jgi:hypothetical protein
MGILDAISEYKTHKELILILIGWPRENEPEQVTIDSLKRLESWGVFLQVMKRGYPIGYSVLEMDLMALDVLAPVLLPDAIEKLGFLHTRKYSRCCL